MLACLKAAIFQFRFDCTCWIDRAASDRLGFLRVLIPLAFSFLSFFLAMVSSFMRPLALGVLNPADDSLAIIFF